MDVSEQVLWGLVLTLWSLVAVVAGVSLVACLYLALDLWREFRRPRR
jgi:hypothetical protein